MIVNYNRKTFIRPQVNIKLLQLYLILIRNYFKCRSVRLELTRVKLFMELCSKGRLQALTTNIRLGWKRETVLNTVAFNHTKFIAPVKSFITEAPLILVTYFLPLGSYSK